VYISFINGGLGNQVFQYIFARYVEERTGRRVYLDDSYFSLFSDMIAADRELRPHPQDTIMHNGFEMERVFPNLPKPRLLSEYYGPEVWAGMIEKARGTMGDPANNFATLYQPRADSSSVLQQIYDGGTELTMISEYAPPRFTGVTLHTPPCRFNSAVADVPGDLYFWGWWIHQGWFDAYRDKLLAELAFPEITDDKNRQYERDIKGSFSIGVHIRRGSFARHGQSIGEWIYAGVINALYERHPGAAFFVFSDEPDWCKVNAQSLGLMGKEAVFVEGNYDYANNYIDMQLMAMCSILVVGNSSFSYLASLLNQTPGFYAEMTKNYPLEDVRSVPM
jgi:hypothetical protein